MLQRAWPYFACDGDRYGERRELAELAVDGVGIHHAGMLRSDRNLVERLFREGLIKVPSSSYLAMYAQHPVWPPTKSWRCMWQDIAHSLKLLPCPAPERILYSLHTT